MSQYPPSFSISTLDGTVGFRIDGAATYDLAGRSVASAGDVNGDGFADMIVGAPYADPDGSNSGAAYVVFGGPAGGAPTLDLSSLDGTKGFRIDGPAAGVHLGFSVGSAGDVNGDGVADMIVGASAAAGDASGWGVAGVVFGKTTGFAAAVDTSALDGSNGFILKDAGAEGYASVSVASAGDINGDGYADLVVGARSAAPNGTYSGSSYVVFGHTGGFAASGVDLSSLDGTDGFRIDGLGALQMAGASVASAGDVNGDGFDDLMVSATYADSYGRTDAGSTYVVFGSASPFDASFDLSSLDGSNGFRLDGAAAGDKAGQSAASAGDVNGDGFDDLIVGARYADSPFNYGAAYVVFGKASGFSAADSLGSLVPGEGFRIGGLGMFAMLGWSVASAGDINGDGFDEVIVGVPGTGAYVVFGGTWLNSLASMDIDSYLNGVHAMRITDPAGELFASSVASAGDVNGDGLADLIVGAYAAGPHGNQSGSSYVIYGRQPDAAVDLLGTQASQSLVGGDFADRLRGAGGDDQLWGHGGGDRIYGNLGDDTLIGGDGNDRMTGGDGDDALNGGAGRDVMTGGAGNDLFLFVALGDSPNTARDHIQDFASGDLIDLGLIDADATTDGDQAFHLGAGDRFTHSAGELVVRALRGDTLVLGDVDGDGRADFAIVLKDAHALAAADFVL